MQPVNIIIQFIYLLALFVEYYPLVLNDFSCQHIFFGLRVAYLGTDFILPVFRLLFQIFISFHQQIKLSELVGQFVLPGFIVEVDFLNASQPVGKSGSLCIDHAAGNTVKKSISPFRYVD